MKKWLAVTGQGDSHVIPLNDLIAHVELRTCTCRPHVEQRELRSLVVHHSADGREYSEADIQPEYQEVPN